MIRFTSFLLVLIFGIASTASAAGPGPCSDEFLYWLDDISWRLDPEEGYLAANSCVLMTCWNVNVPGGCMTACAPGFPSFEEGVCDEYPPPGTQYSRECGVWVSDDGRNCEVCLNIDVEGLEMEVECPPYSTPKAIGGPTSRELR